MLFRQDRQIKVRQYFMNVKSVVTLILLIIELIFLQMINKVMLHKYL
jgi:hypothetical protein